MSAAAPCPSAVRIRTLPNAMQIQMAILRLEPGSGSQVIPDTVKSAAHE